MKCGVGGRIVGLPLRWKSNLEVTSQHGDVTAAGTATSSNGFAQNFSYGIQKGQSCNSVQSLRNQFSFLLLAVMCPLQHPHTKKKSGSLPWTLTRVLYNSRDFLKLTFPWKSASMYASQNMQCIYQQCKVRRDLYLFCLLNISAGVSQLPFAPAWQQEPAILLHCNNSAPHPGLLQASSSVFPPIHIKVLFHSHLLSCSLKEDS